MKVVARTLRLANRTVRLFAPMDVVDSAVGALDAFLVDDAGVGEPDVEIEVQVGGVPPAVAAAPAPANDPWSRVSYARDAGGEQVVCGGLGVAHLPPRGPISIRVVEARPRDEPIAELLTIPALSERLRRDGATLMHGAVLRESRKDGGAWLVPAAPRGGKTTLALSLRGRGFSMLCDDRCFVLDDGDRLLADAWPEAPKVGDRSQFLVPPGLALGPRNPGTGKAPVPSLTPPRLPAPSRLIGCLVPRLVDGAGGATRAVTGASALAAIVSQGLVATDPASSEATLARYASWLSSHPVFEVDVGDDPSRLASAVAALLPSGAR